MHRNNTARRQKGGDMNMSTPKKKIDVPIKDRYLLTYYEAAAYFGIGINRLREICKDPACNFVITTGEKKTMGIRKKLEEYIAEHRYI